MRHMRLNFYPSSPILLSWLDHAGLDRDHFGRKAARALYRAMAIKDEYEVARLLTAPEFQQNLKTAGARPRSPIIWPTTSWLDQRSRRTATQITIWWMDDPGVALPWQYAVVTRAVV